LTVLTILLILNLTGLAIGLSTIEPTEETNPFSGIGTGALYTLVSIWLLTTVVGTMISGVGSVVGGVISTTGDVAGDAFGPAIEELAEDLEVSLDDAKEEFYSLMRDAGIDPDELESDLEDDIVRGLRDGDVEQAFRNARNRLTQTFDDF